MWTKAIKIIIWLLPYLPKAVDYLLKKLKIKKITGMEEKIKNVASVIDEEIDFVNISKKFKNVVVKGLIASIEMFDGTVFELGLSELIDLVPEDKKWIIEKYLDAVLSKNWMVVVDTTADVVNVFVDIDGADENEEKDALAAVMLLMFKFIKSKAAKK